MRNTAGIYFDYDPPIITNTELTTLVDCGLWQPEVTVIAGDVLEATAGDAYQWYQNGNLLADAMQQTLLVPATGDHTVSVTSGFGCTATSDPFTVLFEGIPEHDAARIVALPNSFSEEVRLISSTVLLPTDVIEFQDPGGRIVRSTRGNSSKVLVVQRGELASGLYLVRIVRDGSLLMATPVVVE